MRDLLPCMVLALVGTVFVFAAKLSPRAGENVMVVFPVGTAAEDALVRVIEAGWLPITTPVPSVVLAAPDGVAGRRPAGAWAMLDAMGLRGCR